VSAGHGGGAGFDATVALFNRDEFYTCHDVMEELRYDAEDPARTLLLHDILQCTVGFHHPVNQVVHLIN
jgi:predicted metal-dependent hydrolase